MNVAKILFPVLCLLMLVLNAPVAMAQSDNGISLPASGDIVSGNVVIEGTADDAAFLRYELAFRPSSTRGDWIVFAEADLPVREGTLAVWDTTVGRAVNAAVFPDGPYELRLRVVRTDYNYDEYFVSPITISNDLATPTPTVQVTVPPAGSATLAPDTTPVPGQPAILPSLTPFPSPTVLSAPADTTSEIEQADEPATASDGGLLGQLTAIDYGRFSRAFVDGARIALLLFASMAIYLLTRWAVRRARRLLRERLRRSGSL